MVLGLSNFSIGKIAGAAVAVVTAFFFFKEANEKGFSSALGGTGSALGSVGSGIASVGRGLLEPVSFGVDILGKAKNLLVPTIGSTSGSAKSNRVQSINDTVVTPHNRERSDV